MSDAETLTVRLVRPETGVSWGFRLQGGADFSTPLSIQSVAPGSVADRSGLRAGDGVIYINNAISDRLSHDDAKREILRAGNDLMLTVIRGAVQIWKPKVTPMSELKPNEKRTVQLAGGQEVVTSQKTSLEKEQLPSLKIGSGYNRSARPFGAEPESPKKAMPNVVHAQFNSPIGLYSADNIAATYSMQTAGIQREMERLDIDDVPVGAKMSGTYQPIEGEEGGSEHAQRETENDQQPPSSPTESKTPQIDTQSQDENNSFTNQYNQPSGFKSVRAPETQPMSPQRQQQQQSMHCGLCGNMVTGVFVKAKGVPYHAQCFTCTSCGINLKQKGYFVIEDRLYCEVHAKRLAQPPDPNMKAVPVYR